jgi:hypothetical protein
VILATPTLPALTLAHPPPRSRGSTNLLSFPDRHNHLPVLMSEVHELLIRTVVHKTVCVVVDAAESFTELMFRSEEGTVLTRSIDMCHIDMCHIDMCHMEKYDKRSREKYLQFENRLYSSESSLDFLSVDLGTFSSWG